MMSPKIMCRTHLWPRSIAVLWLALGHSTAFGAASAVPETNERALAARAIAASFERGDPAAYKAAVTFIAKRYPGIDDPNEFLLARLGKLHDAPSLSVLIHELSSANVYVSLFAARGLSDRTEPQAETGMIQAFLAPTTEGDAFGTIRMALEKTGSPAAMRALLQYASERRDVRDEVSVILRGWLAERREATVTELESLGAGADPGIARLARGFLERSK